MIPNEDESARNGVPYEIQFTSGTGWTARTLGVT